MKLICAADSAVSWYWDPSNELPQETSISHYNPLHLYDLQEDAEGYYYCYGLRDGKGFLARSQLLMYGKISLVCLIVEYTAVTQHYLALLHNINI